MKDENRSAKTTSVFSLERRNKMKHCIEFTEDEVCLISVALKECIERHGYIGSKQLEVILDKFVPYYFDIDKEKGNLSVEIPRKCPSCVHLDDNGVCDIRHCKPPVKLCSDYKKVKECWTCKHKKFQGLCEVVCGQGHRGMITPHDSCGYWESDSE
jgi:hypothetical protein